MRDEGVIKFECRWNAGPEPCGPEVQELIKSRQKLFALNLIGVYPDGIGFGNISARLEGAAGFVISASQTGHLLDLQPVHFATVTKYSIEENWVECFGAMKASSESLTHAMIYELFPGARAVVHVHHPSEWLRLQGLVPTTDVAVPYGTPEMAREVARLASESSLSDSKIMVMAGHEDGILTFGTSLESAYQSLLTHLVLEVQLDTDHNTHKCNSH